MMRGLLLVLLFFVSGVVLAQQPVIQLRPTIKEEATGKGLVGVTIEVLQDGKPFVMKTSAANGQFAAIDLPVGPMYTVKIKKEGFVTKIMQINSHTDFPDDLEAFGQQEFETTLFQKVEGVDFSFLEREPMIEFGFNSTNQLVYDAAKLKVMLKKIEDLKKQLAEQKAQQDLAAQKEIQKEKDYSAYLAAGDAAMTKNDYAVAVTQYQAAVAIKADPAVQAKLDNAKKLLADSQNALEQQKKYSDKLAAAKIAYDAKQWDQALALYKEASALSPTEQFPKDRIAEIEKTVANQKANGDAFNKLVAEGDKAVGTQLYDEAITKYTEALKLIVDPAVQKKLDDAKAKKAEKDKTDAAAKAKQDAYNKVIAEADALYLAKNLEGALAKYKEALTVIPGEAHPTQRIAEIEATLKQQTADDAAKKKLEEDYKRLITEANGLFEKSDWATAKSKYEAALLLKPNEVWPKDQIAKILAAIEKEKADTETNAKYVALLNEATNLLSQKKYIEAKAKYNDALLVKPAEQEPKTKIAEIDKILADAEKAQALEQKYKDLMAEGNAAAGIKDYAAALVKFKEALVTKPGDVPAQGKIDEMNKLIADAQKNAEADKKFNEYVNAGNQSFTGKDYRAAKASYLLALGIKEDAPVRAKVAECDELIKQYDDAAANRAKYDVAVKAADALFDKTDYAASMAKYQEALGYMDEAWPKQRIAECQKRMDDIKASAENNAKFSSLVNEANQAYGTKDYETALAKYKEALALKPDPTVSTKVNEINDILEVQNVGNAILAKYQAKIAEADAAFAAKSWESARSLYYEANDIKPDEKYPEDQVAAIEEAMKRETEIEIDAQYQKIITKANTLRDEKKYDEAITYYERAKSVKKADPYPQEQIDAIAKMRSDAVNAEADAKRKQEQYDGYIKAADEAFTAQNWASAIENFKNALTVKPEQQYPKDKIAEIEGKYGDIAALKAKEDQYKMYISLGDASMGAKEWDVAIKNYQEAIEVFADRQYPKDQIKLAQDAKNLLETSATELEFQRIMSAAEKKFIERNYERALELFTQAKELKPADPLPPKRIDEINQILADNTHADKNQEQYDQLIASADNLFHNDKWMEAKAIYRQAHDLINNQYPIDQMHSCDLHAQGDSERERQAMYSKMVAQADSYFGQKSYEKAKDLYVRALGLKPQDKYPKDQLIEIDKILHPEKYLAHHNGMDNLGMPVQGLEAIDAEAMLQEAEFQREWIADKRTEQQGIDFEDRIGQNTSHQENHNFETTSDLEENDIEISEMSWDGETKLSEVELKVIDLGDQVNDVNAIWATQNDNVVQQQTQVVQNIEIDLENGRRDSDFDRQEFEGDMERIKIEVDQKTTNDATYQHDVNLNTKEYANSMEDNHITNDPNRDINTINTEVYVEDYQIEVINKNNRDRWDQEDEVMGVKDEAELLTEEIEAANINNDEPRVEDSETINEMVVDLDNHMNYMDDAQYNATHNSKNYTENLVREIEIENLDNDIPRQQTEINMEGMEVDVQTNNMNMANSQNDVLLHTDLLMDNAEIAMEDHNRAMEEERIGFEKRVEELNDNVELKLEELNSGADNATNDAVEHGEKIIDDSEGLSDNADNRSNEMADNAQEFIEGQRLENEALVEKADNDLNNAGDFVESLRDIDPKKVDVAMKNQLGIEFPDGVTEEVYTLNDENGLLQSIVVRRVVVRNKVGNFYEKVQTRFGSTTYTMNGEGITEYMWQDHTEAADLTRN